MSSNFGSSTTFHGDVHVAGTLYAPSTEFAPSYLSMYNTTDSLAIGAGEVDTSINFPIISSVVPFASSDFSDSIPVGPITGGILYNGTKDKLLQYNYSMTMSSSITVSTMSLEVYKNDIAVPGSKSLASALIAGDGVVVSAPFMVLVSRGDKLNGYITSSTAATVTVSDMSLIIREVSM